MVDDDVLSCSCTSEAFCVFPEEKCVMLNRPVSVDLINVVLVMSSGSYVPVINTSVTSEVIPTIGVLDIASVVCVVVCDAVLLAVFSVVTMLNCLLDDDNDDDGDDNDDGEGVVVEVSVEVPKVCVLDMTVLLSAGKVEPENKIAPVKEIIKGKIVIIFFPISINMH